MSEFLTASLPVPGVRDAVEDKELPEGPTQSSPVSLGPQGTTLPQPPVMETGQAGPPGKITSTFRFSKGTNGSMMPILGFAGAPG